MQADALPDYVLGLGSNLGARLAYLHAASALLQDAELRVLAHSAVYESEPVGPPQPRYLNAALAVRSALPPAAVLERALAVEQRLGRERRQRWGPRVIDIDLLWAPAAVQEAGLVIPHPSLCERWFALVPLIETAPALGPRYADAVARLAHAPAPFARAPWLRPVRCRRAGAEVLLQVDGDDLDAQSALLVALGTLLAYGRVEEEAVAATGGVPLPDHGGSADLRHAPDDAARRVRDDDPGGCLEGQSAGHALAGADLWALAQQICALGQRGRAFGVAVVSETAQGPIAALHAPRPARYTAFAASGRREADRVTLRLTDLRAR